LRDSTRRLWGQWWWGWLSLWRSWLLFRLLVQSFYNAGCLCHGRRWCWRKHIYRRKSDSEKELKFSLPFCFLGSHAQVFLLQDLPPSKKNVLLHVINNFKQKAIHALEGASLWKQVYLLFHLIKVRELTSTSIHSNIKVQAKKILTKVSHILENSRSEYI